MNEADLMNLQYPAPYGSDTSIPSLNPERLRKAIHAADIRVLLMVLVHLSGDRKWILEPYQPKRDVRLIADEAAGLSRELCTEIREAAVQLLENMAGQKAAIAVPDETTMTEMMRNCMGEAISEAYTPMMLEEMGFVSRDPPNGGAASNLRVAIVGAGVSGLIIGARLKRLGIDFTILEKKNEVGGIWRDNSYPGCGVDTPNHAYSFSLGGRYPWSSFFSSRDELFDYLKQSADAFALRSNIRFGAEVLSTTWIEERHTWQIEILSEGGRERLEVPVVVSAVGQFGVPSVPSFDGLDRFRGQLFHSSDWPAGLDLKGRSVAIIGTGASSMQIAPSIAGNVGKLDIYQRSPQWARPIPRYHERLSDDALWLLENVPFYAAWFRFAMLWRYGDGLLPYLRRDPAWPHPERSLNAVNDRHRQEMTDHIHRELAGRTDIVGKCLPTYPPYGKRILLDNGWYQTLVKPEVELVTESIHHFDETGIVTADGRVRPADIVVMATGFRVSEMTARLNVTGRNGKDLREFWGDDNATAYLGIAVPGFPNLFIMQGPSTGLGHGGSQICQAESQARYITMMLTQMAEGGILSVDVRHESHDGYIELVDRLHQDLIWTHPGMSTYYRNRHGRVVSVSPFSLLEYWTMTHEVNLSDYHIALRD